MSITSTAVGQATLRKEFIALGLYRKATGRILFELALNAALAIGGILVFLESHMLLIRICGILISTFGSMGVGTNTHTSSHNATADKRWINELLTYLGYPFFLGLSATFWWHKHVVVHHPSPNIVGIDDDVDLLPWFARTREDVEQARGLRRFYYERLQWIVLPFALAGNTFNMQKSGWVYLLSMLRQSGSRKPAHWIDLGALLLHFTTNLAIPMFFFAPQNVVLFYLLRFGVTGYTMFAVLGPGHFPVEAACVEKEQNGGDYLLLQTAATVNFRTGMVGGLMCSGLEYQIEHHLFPNVSHVNYPKMSPLVREYCAQHGLPYRSYGWGHVLWKCLCAFRTPPRVEPRLEALRLPVKN
jgi:fatty acid desaturase